MNETETATPPAIAALIRAGRLRKGWTQKQLAAEAGVSRTTLLHLEQGAVQHPQGPTLSRLAAALDLSPDDIARESPPRPRTPPPIDRPDDFPLHDHHARLAFDQHTNAVVFELCEAEPEHFRGFEPADWEELSSQVGVGGGLTQEGVRTAAARIQADKQTIHKLRVLLQTHLREPARQVIDALFQSVSVTPGRPAVP